MDRQLDFSDNRKLPGNQRRDRESPLASSRPVLLFRDDQLSSRLLVSEQFVVVRVIEVARDQW